MGPGYFILGYLLFAALYAGVGSIGTNAREAQMARSGIFVMPAVAPMWVSSYIIAYPDSVLAKGRTFFPERAHNRYDAAAQRCHLGVGVGLEHRHHGGFGRRGHVGRSQAFRVFLLMYGKRPRLKEIIASIREA